MGTSTYGFLSVGFSRELTDEELESWMVRVRAGRPGFGECANTHHGHAPLEIGEVDGKPGLRCEHFGTPERGGYCYSDSERYDPEGWTFDDGWGDVGIMRPGDTGFEVEAGGKVYDLEDGVRWFVECLPEDVTASGASVFDSDGYRWVLAVDGRTVGTDDVVELRASLWNALMEACESRSIVTHETGKPDDGILPRLRLLVEEGVLSG